MLREPAPHALAVLRSAGLRGSLVGDFVATYLTDIVIAQSPAPGVVAKEGTTVKLSLRPAPAPKPPVISSVTWSRETFDDGTLIFHRPAPGQSPGITARRAARIVLGTNPYHLTASAQFGLFTDRSARPILHNGTKAPLTWVDVPVWLVTVDNFCSPYPGFVSSAAPSPPSPCVYRAIINASSGRDIQDFG